MWHDVKALNTLTAAMLVAALVLIFGAGGRWLMLRPVFNLHQITVESAPDSALLRRVNVLTVRSVALPRIQGNFFTVNLEAVRSAFEAVPWVRHARVRRAWPDRLVVTVDEYQPLGTWGDDGRLLSQTGEIFIANQDEAEEDGALLQFSGPDNPGAAADVRRRLEDFRAWFAPLKLAPVEVHLSERYAWTIVLDNGVRVELGRERDADTLQQRVARLTRIYPELVARWPDGIERIDLRYQNGLALKPAPVKKPEKAPESKSGGRQAARSPNRN